MSHALKSLFTLEAWNTVHVQNYRPVLLGADVIEARDGELCHPDLGYTHTFQCGH